MTIKVQPLFPSLSSDHTHIGRIGSAVNFAAPIIAGANHLAGYRMGALIHSYWHTTRSFGEGGAAGSSAKFYTHRYPNCSHLAAVFCVQAVSTYPGSVAIKAGSGATQTFSIPTEGGYSLSKELIPWGAADTGDQIIEYSSTNCQLGGMMIFNAHRLDLDYSSGDECVEDVNENEHRAGMSPGKYIIDGSQQSKIDQITATIRDFKDNWHPQFLSYAYPGQDHTFNASSWASYTHQSHSTSCEWRHASTQFDGEAWKYYRVFVQTYIENPSGNTYDWRFRNKTTGQNASQTGLSNTSWAWSNDNLLVATAGGNYEFQMQCTSATPTLHFRFLSVYED